MHSQFTQDTATVGTEDRCTRPLPPAETAPLVRRANFQPVIRYRMRVVLDYGGVLVDHVDEREYAHLLGVSSERDPYPGWIAYAAFRSGMVNTEQQYVDLLSTLTGASEKSCLEYVDRTWLDPQFPSENRTLLAEIAADHSLVLFSNMAKQWVEEVLRDHGVRDLFDSVLVSSELARPKPHPRGYHRCTDGVDGKIVMVSDEFNEDLLMAHCFGMTTVWVENDEEVPYRDPEYSIGDVSSLPSVLDDIEQPR
jgi:FMN phosphatase YigB (HAD superfamily)